VTGAADLDWFAGRRCLVTGGMGFIGSHLAQRLVELGSHVTIVDSLIPAYGGNPYNVRQIQDNVQLSVTDIRDRYAMAYLVKDQDVVFNLAGQVSHIDSMSDPEPDLEINCKAQLMLMEALRSSNDEARVVFASTRQVYGKPEYLPVDERHPVHPTDVNGINKHAGEQYHMLYSSVYGIPTVVLRLTNTYGPHQLMHHSRQGFIPVFIRTAMEGGTIRLFGGGVQRRDANYVSDVVDAFLRAALAADEVSGRIFNLGGRPSFSLLDFADILVKVVGKGGVESVPWPADKAKIDIGDFEADFSRITSELGWQPVTDLATGLERTVAFYAAHGEHYW